MDYITPTAELQQRYLGFLKKTCREINTPLSKRVLRELNRNVVRSDRLPDLNPDDYSLPVDLIKDRLILGLVTKWPGLHLDKDPEDECLKTFWKFEAQCRETNNRLESGQLAEPDVEAVLLLAREKIQSILGPCPEPKDLPFSFGPGASRNVRGRTTPFHKLIAEPECTLEARNDALRIIKSVPWLWTFWGGTETSCPKLKIVHGSRFGQVPKSAKTNRPIDIEPTLNGVLQRGLGSLIRDRLARAGNCLRSGQTRHAELSRLGSIFGDLATLDKSGASDSISTHLVLRLLPSDWFDALYNARSHRHDINGAIYDLEKFSAMGNGYTFELESLIFLTLARACAHHLGVKARGEISIFGDDLICPQSIVPLYEAVCSFCGFTINTEKSFVGSSWFRESCGADWFCGVDVRVAYMRHNASPHYLTTLHNRMFELGLHHLIPESFSTLQEIVPERFRVFGPSSDHKYGYLFSEKRQSCTAVALRPNKRRPNGDGAYAYGMYTLQFLHEEDLTAGFSIDPDGFIDFSQWKGSIDMSRLTTRNDFKVGRRQIRFDGSLQKKLKIFKRRVPPSWGQYKVN